MQNRHDIEDRCGLISFTLLLFLFFGDDECEEVANPAEESGTELGSIRVEKRKKKR